MTHSRSLIVGNLDLLYCVCKLLPAEMSLGNASCKEFMLQTSQIMVSGSPQSQDFHNTCRKASRSLLTTDASKSYHSSSVLGSCKSNTDTHIISDVPNSSNGPASDIYFGQYTSYLS